MVHFGPVSSPGIEKLEMVVGALLVNYVSIVSGIDEYNEPNVADEGYDTLSST